MDNNRRFLLAIALSAIVLVAFNFFFPTAPPPRAAARPAAAGAVAAGPAAAAPNATAAAALGTTPGAAPAAAADSGTPAAAAETVLVAGSRAAYQVSAQGAALVGAEMRGYKSLRPGENDRPVQLARRGEPLVSFRLVTPGDTIPLARTAFRVTQAPGTNVVRLDGVALGRVAGSGAGVGDLRLRARQLHRAGERERADHARAGVPPRRPAAVARHHRARLGRPLRAPVVRLEAQAGRRRPRTVRQARPGRAARRAGPLSWAVTKSKYFLVGALARGASGFTELTLEGGPRTSKDATQARATLVMPGRRRRPFDLYAGPQECRRLAAMGRDFEEANPYGGWFQGMVQPFSTLAIRVILGLHDKFGLGYGWILVLLGIVVRLVLWPLQQNMMRNQIKMQRLQPELQLVQQRHKNDPQKLQQEMMKVYASHGMTPFAPITGCLPMLLPMPIFFALFFVFQNTIEFRGVPFLWLGDISLKDPFYALPVLVAGTQFLISWIGMRGTPPNPQTQTITYMMPAMFLIFFVNVAAGLNLYYLTQNLVMIPQQWLLSRERIRAGGTPPTPPVEGTPVRGGAGAKNPKLRPA
jgi:YidC/Oxa1 family membrane protein insertase